MKRKRTGGLTFEQEEIPSGDCPAGAFSDLRLCSGAGPGGAPVGSACQTASETYGLKTEAVMERKVVPYVRDFLLTGEEQLSIVRNGSFYNIDQGIEPDVVLTQVESFYDREGLVDYLHTIK